MGYLRLKLRREQLTAVFHRRLHQTHLQLSDRVSIHDCSYLHGQLRFEVQENYLLQQADAKNWCKPYPAFVKETGVSTFLVLSWKAVGWSRE